jgi:hypothetical protein
MGVVGPMFTHVSISDSPSEPLTQQLNLATTTNQMTPRLPKTNPVSHQDAEICPENQNNVFYAILDYQTLRFGVFS